MSERKRIGVMVPSTNTTCEADFQMVVPRGYTVHGQRLWLTNDALGEDGMIRMNGEIESGARYLATARVDAISYGCTTGSFFKGPGWDREMIEVIERTAKCPRWRRARRSSKRCDSSARSASPWRRRTPSGTTCGCARIWRRTASRF
jgi:maleate cis-trans isomerase